MSYHVHLTQHAKSLLNEYADYIKADSPQEAVKWLTVMARKMASLATFPEGLPLARENDSHTRELRQKVHGRYRIIFFVDGEQVNIVSIRHTAQLPHDSGELDSVH